MAKDWLIKKLLYLDNSDYISHGKMIFQMQKIIACIFLVFFSAAQYGKLISYWKCKITNSSDTRAVQCDCEKILTDTMNGKETTVLARVHVKDKTEEWHQVQKVQIPTGEAPALSKAGTEFRTMLSTGFTAYIFRPPSFFVTS
jgi:hypothetical protein